MTREEKEALRSAECSKHNLATCPEDSSCKAWSGLGNGRIGCKATNELTDAELDRCVQRIKPDMVNSPKHYELPGGMEVIDVEIAALGREAVMEHCLCTAVEYLLRHKRKNGTEDVKKAHWWLTKYVELEATRNE